MTVPIKRSDQTRVAGGGCCALLDALGVSLSLASSASFIVNRHRSLKAFAALKMAPLQIAAGQPRTLAYSQAIRKDIKLLEVDEGLLDELLQSG